MKSRIDLASFRLDYEVDNCSLVELGRRYGCSDGNIRYLAKIHAWDATTRVRQWAGTGPSEINRFMKKYIPEPNSGCWLWIGAIGTGGYGNFWNGDHLTTAHRAAYVLFIGQIPLVLDLDHKCRVRSCVNPDHLEPVTRKENLARGIGRWHAGRPTVCKHGHPLVGTNEIIKPDGRRACRECVRRHSREFVRKRRGVDPANYRVK